MIRNFKTLVLFRKKYTNLLATLVYKLKIFLVFSNLVLKASQYYVAEETFRHAMCI